SLRAAMRPERTEDLYFVADGGGGHIFAKTLADQNRNIAQYRKAGVDLGPLPPPDAPLAAPAAASAPSGGAETPRPAGKSAAPRPTARTSQEAARQNCHPTSGHACP